MSANLNEIWEMINTLPLEEKKLLYKKMQEDVKQRLNDILDNVNRRAEDDWVELETITEEVETVRGNRYEHN